MLQKIILLASVPLLILGFSVRLYAQDESEFIRPVNLNEVIQKSALSNRSLNEDVEQLLNYINEGYAQENSSCVTWALNGIAGLRARTAVPVLLDRLGVKVSVFNVDNNICYALKCIGKPASLECLRRLALQDERDEKGKLTSKAITMLHVIKDVEGDNVAKFMLESAIAKEQDEKRKENLTAALELLNSRITKKAEGECLQPDERQDADDTEPPPRRRSAEDGEAKPAETQVPSTAASARSGFPWYFAGLVGFVLGIGITFLFIVRKK